MSEMGQDDENTHLIHISLVWRERSKMKPSLIQKNIYPPISLSYERIITLTHTVINPFNLALFTLPFWLRQSSNWGIHDQKKGGGDQPIHIFRQRNYKACDPYSWQKDAISWVYSIDFQRYPGRHKWKMSADKYGHRVCTCRTQVLINSINSTSPDLFWKIPYLSMYIRSRFLSLKYVTAILSHVAFQTQGPIITSDLFSVMESSTNTSLILTSESNWWMDS